MRERPEPVCYIDLDGVLADMHAAAFELVNRTPPTEPYEFYGAVGVTHDAFFGLTSYEWWANLKPTEYMEDILQLVDAHFPRSKQFILTAPPWMHDREHPGLSFASAGKIDWVAKHLPKHFRTQTFIGNHKQELAKPGAVLIDDTLHQCLRFYKAGGSALFVPGLWNTREMDRIHNRVRGLREGMQHIVQGWKTGTAFHNTLVVPQEKTSEVADFLAPKAG
jgi:hypothetical protein